MSTDKTVEVTGSQITGLLTFGSDIQNFQGVARWKGCYQLWALTPLSTTETWQAVFVWQLIAFGFSHLVAGIIACVRLQRDAGKVTFLRGTI